MNALRANDVGSMHDQLQQKAIIFVILISPQSYEPWGSCEHDSIQSV